MIIQFLSVAKILKFECKSCFLEHSCNNLLLLLLETLNYYFELFSTHILIRQRPQTTNRKFYWRFRQRQPVRYISGKNPGRNNFTQKD